MIQHCAVETGELLALLREELGPGLSFAEPPVRLGGGFYTDNYSFRVTGGPPEWDVPLVLRLFPEHAPAELAEREATVQRLAFSSGVAAPPVLLYRKRVLLAGREWFIMARLPGRPLLGSLSPWEVVRLGPGLLRRLPGLTAETQLALHRTDPSPLIDVLGERGAGVGRWLDLLQQRVESGADGLTDACEWLVEHQPPAGRIVLCHGDLWGGNLLVDHRRVTGVIDWTLATAAEPALDVGFTTMTLDLAPVPVPPRIRRGLLRLTRQMGRRYLRLYRKGSDADLSKIAYYEALRCVIELSGVIGYRTARIMGLPDYGPRPPWDWIADDVLDYFTARTAVSITLPPAT